MTIAELHKVFLHTGSVCTDTRKIVPGSIFFALKGEQFDGNDFALEAIKKGCRLAVADRQNLRGTKDTIVVDSALQTLQDLAHYHRITKNITILAITGSNGKTTTKELTAAILSRKYKVLSTSGNLNNHIGVPLTLLQIKNEDFGVIEMGANHKGEISLLAAIASPEYGLITNIGKAHLEGFGSIKGVLEAKGELYQYLARNSGKAFVNIENELLLKRANDAGLDVLPYNDDKLSGKMVDAYPGLKCEISLSGEILKVRTNLVGGYNLENIISAVAVGRHFGISNDDIVKALESYQSENKRSQLIKGIKNTIVLDAYNANPTSMIKSISNFIEFAKGPKMVILGDMFELGNEEGEEHRLLIDWLRKQPLQKVLLIGRAFKRVAMKIPGYQYFPDTDSCNAFLRDEKPGGFHILIKGSRKMALESTTIHLTD